MTARQLLDRTILRVCNRDIRFMGAWERLGCVAGYERDVAEAIVRLDAGVDEGRLLRKLQTGTIDEIVAQLEACTGRSEDTNEPMLF